MLPCRRRLKPAVFGGVHDQGNRRFSPSSTVARRGFVVSIDTYRLGMGERKRPELPDEAHFTQSVRIERFLATEFVRRYGLRTHAGCRSPDGFSRRRTITIADGEYGICNAHPWRRRKLKQDFSNRGILLPGYLRHAGQVRWTTRNPAPMMLFTAIPTTQRPYGVVGSAGVLLSSETRCRRLTRRTEDALVILGRQYEPFDGGGVR